MDNAIQIENLTKIYANGTQALHGISLNIQTGDFFALLGPNGSGKSTTIGIITSLVNKTSGRVTVCGHDLDKDRIKVKQCIGLVPQEFNFSIFESVYNIVMNQAGYYGIPRAAAHERTEYYLHALGLYEKRHDASRTLSGGMKRRLMIARGLVHQPKILILDEPTAGVDLDLRRGMWVFLQKLNSEGVTIILTTHYLEEAESLCRNVAILNHGRIVQQDQMQNVLKDGHRLETLFLEVTKDAQT